MSGLCGWNTVWFRRCSPSAASVPCFFSPSEMAERRRVILKCVAPDSGVGGRGTPLASTEAGGVLVRRRFVRRGERAGPVLYRHTRAAMVEEFALFGYVIVLIE
jgi:hypothetical protein